MACVASCKIIAVVKIVWYPYFLMGICDGSGMTIV